jgi:PAS domain S-box-containing protein
MVEYTKKILDLLKQNPVGLSVTQIGKELNVNRNSAARYLDVLHTQGAIQERKIGPAKVYIVSENLPFATQLSLFEQAMDQASCGITIADANKPDKPLIYVNDEFLNMSGYTREDVIGKNCRFLQGAEKNTDARKKIRQALAKDKSVKVVLKNFKKDGTLFYNELFISPISSDKKEVTHYVGIQTDITFRYE